MTLDEIAPRPRISTKLNLVAVLSGLALCALSIASVHFAQRISAAASHIRTHAFTAVVASAELGVLLERHRRIIESAPVTFDKIRIDRDTRVSEAIASQIEKMIANTEDHFVDAIGRHVPELIDRGRRVLYLSANFAQDEALKAVDDYSKVAKRVQDRIVTYRESNLRNADDDTATLMETVRRLVNWVQVAALFSAALIGPLTIIAVRRIAERLRRITETMRAISHDRLETAIPSQDERDEIGEMARAVAVFKRNAIALKHNHAEIAALNARIDIALNNMTRGLSMFDGEGRLIVVNRICLDMYGLPETLSEAGTPFEAIVSHWAIAHSSAAPEETRASVHGWLARHAERIRAGEEFSELHKLADGRIYAITTKPLLDGGWIDVHEDITEKHRSAERVAELAQKDTLTGLGNRHSFLEELARTFGVTGSAEPFAILWIDLDRFKEVNDTCGHPAGDALLAVIAGRLRSAVRTSDVVARLGGDEFAIIIRGPGIEHGQLTRIAARIIDIVGDPVHVLGHTVRVGASVGISRAPDDGATPDEIMKSADIALYRAKSDGRGRAVFFDGTMAAEIQKKHKLQGDLDDAVRNHRLELYYQPILSVTSRRVVAMEALMRWRHNELGFISPAEFIPLAEETGLITLMGAWALETACVEAAKWPDNVAVSVNLSAAQFVNADLDAIVRAALASSALDPARLQLEVTETLLLDDQPETWQTLAALKNLGLSIALDDFGTGYSSLSYLRSFPFDKIKIDQSFVRDIGRQTGSSAIIRAIVDLARTLGMTCVAEGIETAAHLSEIEAAHCDEVQGYLFSRPVPAAQVAETIAACERVKAA